MSRIYSQSFFHYTKDVETLLSIIENGFYASYANEQFKDNSGKLNHLYIPMISFCDIPLIHFHSITYGKYGIGVSRSWGNGKLAPVMYYPLNKKNMTTKFCADTYDAYIKDRKKHKELLGYIKPYKKYNERGYAVGRRRDNYIEREWRKIWLGNWLHSDGEYQNYIEAHGSKVVQKFQNKFKQSDVTFLIVDTENEKNLLITDILKLKTIGGYHCDKEMKLELVSKIVSLESINKNF
ncbi:MAG: hypothetical protein IJ394_06415 [Bacteroidales bacterium]|nr:hypothetical protein [Bacteroidales bacterium]